MAEPTWDDVKLWMKEERIRWTNNLRKRGVELRIVDEANASLDMLDRLAKLEQDGTESAEAPGPVFVQ